MWIEPTIRIDAGVEYQAKIIPVGQDAVHELPAHLAEFLLALRIPEKILAALTARAVHTHDWLGQKARAQSHVRRDLAADQLVELNLIRGGDHFSITIIDLE